MADTKNLIIKEAERLMLTQGYQGFSYAHIADALEIRNAAIHYHFPTKGDLGAAVIRRARKRFKKWQERPELLQGTPKFQLLTFIQQYDNLLMADQRMCLLNASGSSAHAIPKNMREEAREYSQDLQKFLAQLLKQGRQSNLLHYAGKAKDQALQILSTLTGSLMLARIRGEEAYQTIADQLLLNLSSKVEA